MNCVVIGTAHVSACLWPVIQAEDRQDNAVEFRGQTQRALPIAVLDHALTPRWMRSGHQVQ